MGALTGQTIANSYEQLLHVDTDGGGSDTPTTFVPVKDGDNGVTFAIQLSQEAIVVDNPTTGAADKGGMIRLQSDDGTAMNTGERLGVVQFSGAEDTSSTITEGAKIEAICDTNWGASENGTELRFSITDADASSSEALRLAPGAASILLSNAALGHSSPDGSDWNANSAIFHLKQNDTNGSIVVVESSNAKGVFGGGNAKVQIGSISNDDLTFHTNASLRMTIDTSGNIGATSGTNIHNASDERLKKNVSSLSNSLDIVNQLNPVKFNWIDDFVPSENDKVLYGFIAQEVQDVFPDVVESFTSPDKDGNPKDIVVGDKTIDNALTVREKFLIPVLTKAIQELSAKVTALENA